MSGLRPQEVDRLLRDTLREAWGPGEEAALRAALRLSWARARAGESRSAPRTAGLPVPALRAALGVAASLAIVAAVALHLVFPPRLVAGSLAARNAALGALELLDRAAVMTCVVDVDAEGLPGRYRVEWRAAGETRVAIDREGAATWTTRVPPDGATLVLPERRDRSGEDPRLSPVRAFLGPERLAAVLRSGRARLDRASGSWLRVQLEDGGNAVCELTPAAKGASLAGTSDGRQ